MFFETTELFFNKVKVKTFSSFKVSFKVSVCSLFISPPPLSQLPINHKSHQSAHSRSALGGTETDDSQDAQNYS